MTISSPSCRMEVLMLVASEDETTIRQVRCILRMEVINAHRNAPSWQMLSESLHSEVEPATASFVRVCHSVQTPLTNITVNRVNNYVLEGYSPIFPVSGAEQFNACGATYIDLPRISAMTAYYQIERENTWISSTSTTNFINEDLRWTNLQIRQISTDVGIMCLA